MGHCKSSGLKSLLLLSSNIRWQNSSKENSSLLRRSIFTLTKFFEGPNSKFGNWVLILKSILIFKYHSLAKMMSFSYLMQRYLIAIDQLISEKPRKLRPRWGSGRCTIENSLLVRYQMLILFANPYSSWRHWNWIVAKIVIVVAHSIKI